MKKFLLKSLAVIGLFALPLIAFATIGAGWNATSITAGIITPTAINGTPQAIAVTSTATSTIANFNTILDASTFSGANMCAKINSAYAALPTNGGTITIPAGIFTCSTSIVFGTAGKVAQLKGAGGGGFYAPGATTLVYTNSTGVLFTYNVNNYSSAGVGLYNISLVGHAGVTGIGVAVAPNVASTTADFGVWLGGSNGATGFTMQGVQISGFGVGLGMGDNIFLLNVDGSVLQKNGVNIQSLAASGAVGENNRVTNSILADSNSSTGTSISNYCVYVQESGNVQWSFTNNSIDDCQLFSTQSGGTANIWKLTSNHFENPNFNVPGYPFFAMLPNQPAMVVDSTNNDYMNDDTANQTAEDILNGGTFNSANDTVEINNNTRAPISHFVINQDSTNVDNVSWTGLTQAFANSNAGLSSAVTYIYGTAPFPTAGSTQGVGSGQDNGVALIATQFAGSDIGAQVNAAYATGVAAGRKGITIDIPNGKYSFSTPIVCGTNGVRCLIEGSPAEGVELDYTGTGAAITLNDGIQGVGVDHTSGQGLSGLYLRGNNYSTTSPQIGVVIGGTNGNDGAVLNSVNIFHFGYGLQVVQNAYHMLYENGTIRDNGQNVHINAASNSGESIDFLNAFIVDGANKDAFDCIWMDNSATASFNYTGGSFDDCQMHILQANNVTITGTHVENPGSATNGWGSYTPIVIDNNLATNVDLNGITLFDTSRNGFVPPNYISNGGNVTLNGVIVRQFSGSTMTNFMTLTGSGRVSWIGLNDVSGTAFTNVYSGVPYTTNGTSGAYTLGPLGTPAGAFLAVNPNGQIIATTSPTSGSGTVSSGLAGQLGYYNVSGTTQVGTSTNPLYVSSLFATSTSLLNNLLGNTGIASSTPWAMFAVNPVAGQASNEFVVGSSTSTSLLVNNSGYVGIGTTNPAPAAGVAGINVLQLGDPVLSTGSQFRLVDSAIQGRVFVGSSAFGFGTDNSSDISIFTNGGGNPKIYLSGAGTNEAFSTTTTNTLYSTTKFLFQNLAADNYANEFIIASATATSNTNLFVVRQNGNVGIGTTTPTATFSIDNASSTAGTIQGTPFGRLLGMVVAGTEYMIESFDYYGHRYLGGPSTTVTGGTSSVVGNDGAGTITVVGTVLTSVTLNFAKPWLTTPVCTESDNSTAITADISSISTTQVVFGFSAGINSGTVWYQCVGTR